MDIQIYGKMRKQNQERRFKIRLSKIRTLHSSIPEVPDLLY
jgi:hypothetical protein